jgi:hypothetical protein
LYNFTSWDVLHDLLDIERASYKDLVVKAVKKGEGEETEK